MWRYHLCRNDRNQVWGDYKVNLDRCVTLCFLTLHDQLVTICTTGFNIKEFYFLAPGVFLGSFAKLRKATISFVVFVCPSVCPRGTTLLPLDGFLRKFIFEYFSKKKFEKIQVLLKSVKNEVYCTWRPVYIFYHISLISS